MSGEKNAVKTLFWKIGRFIKRHKIIVIIFLVIIIALCVFIKIRGKFHKNDTDKNQNMIQTTTLKKRDLTTSVSVTGTIASSDKREVTTNFSDTEVTEVPVSVGDYVEEGATIIVFDSSDLEEEYETTQDDYELNSLKQNQSLEQAQENVEEAQDAYEEGVSEQASLVADALSEYNTAQSKEADALSAYESAQSATTKAKKAYTKLKEQKSTLKSAMDTAEKENQEKQAALSQAKSAYEAAEANIKYASEADENYANLNQTYTDAYNAYTQADAAANEAQKKAEQAKTAYEAIEQAKKAYEEAQAAEEAAKTAYEEAVTNSSNKSSAYNKAVETQAETNQKNAENIEDSKENLTITSKEVSNNKKTQTKQLKEAEEKLGKCVVTSPISGYITAINVEVGDTYNGSDTLFVVQDMSELVVDATVDEYDISSLKKDQEAVIKTDATGEEELKGVLTYVAMTPDESENSSMGSSNSSSGSSSGSSYTIQITLNDTNEALRIGMTAKTSIILESASDVYAIPYDCVETDKEGNSYITVLDEEAVISSEEKSNTTKRIPVEVGIESDYYVEISGEGLEEGLLIVTPETVGVSTENNTDQNNFFGGGMPGGGMPGENGGGKQNGRNKSDNGY